MYAILSLLFLCIPSLFSVFPVFAFAIALSILFLGSLHYSVLSQWISHFSPSCPWVSPPLPLLTRDLFTALHLISVYGYLYCSPSSVFGSLQCSPSLPIQYLPSALTLFFLNISALSPSSLSLDLPRALLNHCG